MAHFTFLEVHFEDASFSADLPFGGGSGDGEAVGDVGEQSSESDDVADEAEGSLPTKALLAGVLLLLVVAVAAAAKYRSGGDEPEVEIETSDDEPVGVTVSDE